MTALTGLAACATTTIEEPAAVAAAPAEPAAPVEVAAPAQPAATANPLLAQWSGEYGGVPAFDQVRAADFPAAFEAAIAERKREIDAIIANPAPATFENTVLALERSGQTFTRVNALFGIYTSSMNDEAFQALERDWAPKLQAASDEILLNRALFDRIDAVWTGPEKARLSPEQQRLTWRTHDAFFRAGAKVEPTQKTRLAAVNQELAKLYADFGQKVLADENTWTALTTEAELAGLPDSLKAAYKAAAEERKLPGWVVVNTRSSVDPFLTYSSRRDLREKVWTAFKNRGDNRDAEDTNATIAKIMPLRAEKARLLGYPTFAHWKLSDKMAANPQRASELLLTVWKPTTARIREEVADMQKIATKDGVKTFEPWDYVYYAEKVRKAKYDLDQNELKPYFELNKMIDASMWMANQLYGLSFKEISGKVPVFHPDVRAWEVWEGDRFVGLFYGDYFARAGKRSGAWENAYRSQSNEGRRVTPLVSNNNNFVRGAPGEPVLISLDDAETLFHEFGHAIHDLLSNVTYESLSGTNTSTDFVEMPSQVHENWVLTPEVLDRFARHYKTGQPFPKALLQKVEAASKFNQGYATGEYLASAIVDMELHTVPDGRVDPDRFERETLQRIGVPRELVMRHRLPHFNHLFTDEGYAAGYYSYLWSDTMGADAWKAFEETGNVWDKATAARMKAMMAAGDSVDQAELYRRFRGRDPEVNALLEQRGFPAGATKASN